MGAPAPPLAPPLQVGLVKKTCYAILTVASSFSETARSNKTVEASARIHARVWYYRPEYGILDVARMRVHYSAWRAGGNPT